MISKIAKGVMRKMGLRLDDLLVPYYLIPYNFADGKALNPLKATIELTYRCNLMCKMCPLEIAKEWHKTGSAGKNSELTTDEIKKFVKDLKAIGIKSILLTGGEPFLRNDINEIVRHIKKNGIYCAILSNGYFITREHAKTLISSGVDLISFSMDGPENIHNRIRGVGNSFQKICGSIKLLKDEQRLSGKFLPKIILNCTISALNQNCISEIVEIANSLDVKLVDYMYLFYTDEDKINATKKVMNVGQLKPESQILPDGIKNVDSQTLIKQVGESKFKAKRYNITVGFNPPLKDIEIESRFFDDSFSFSSKCFYPWYETRVDPHGNVYPCSLDVPMGNIREVAFKEIWNGGKYIDFRNSLKEHGLLPMCAKCCKLVHRYWSNLPVFSKKRKVQNA